MPSKIFSMMPGPSVAESGAPVPFDGLTHQQAGGVLVHLDGGARFR